MQETKTGLLKRQSVYRIHGDELVDIPFPVKVRDELIAAGRAELHHIFPKMGAVSFWLRESEDVQHAIELLRVSYELAVKQRARRKPGVEP